MLRTAPARVALFISTHAVLHAQRQEERRAKERQLQALEQERRHERLEAERR